HAFNQSAQTEQTTVYLTFARGYVVLSEWVPTSLELTTPVARSAWEGHLPGMVDYMILPDGRTRARAIAPQGKSALYRECIQAGMRDLVEAIHYPERQLRVTGDDALQSLRVAAEAATQTMS